MSSSMDNSTFSGEPKYLVDDILDGVSVARPYLILLITVTGIVGNLLSVIVFAQQSNWERSGLHYLICLAISDTGYLSCAFGIRGLKGNPFNVKFTLTVIPVSYTHLTLPTKA